MSVSRVSISKFRGCLLGGLIGDCFGSADEGSIFIDVDRLCSRMNGILKGEPAESDAFLEFTDDTAMAIGLCESLLEKRGLDMTHLAKTFASNYFKEPDRGYGLNAENLYKTLDRTAFADVVGPAAKLNDGEGSMGNGGAMRVAPMALFGAEFGQRDPARLVALTSDATRVTHAHPKGLAGTVLQCLAVHRALLASPDDVADPTAFLDALRSEMAQLSGSAEFERQLKEMEKELRQKKDKVDRSWVVKTLGHNIVAPKSVGTALYAFLRSCRPVQGIDVENPFVRCVLLAVSFGGDTDTIACMAGAMAGALYGVDAIPDELARVCEAEARVDDFARRLHALVYPEEDSEERQ